MSAFNEVADKVTEKVAENRLFGLKSSLLMRARKRLIEWRMPHPHISAVVAEAKGRQVEYMRKKELHGSRCMAMLIDYIGKFNGLSRKEIND